MARKPGNTREATRAAIVEAAEKLFISTGFAGAPLSEIAKEAGVTKSLIHYHFGSKQELWDEIKHKRFSDLAMRLRKVFASPAKAEDFVEQSFTAYFEFLQQNPQLLRLMWWRQAERSDEEKAAKHHATAEIREFVDEGIERLAQLQRDGVLRKDLEPRFVFASFLALVRHWFAARRDFALVDAHEEDVEADAAYVKTAIRIFLDGVIAKPNP